jgi:hypothetical protein
MLKRTSLFHRGISKRSTEQLTGPTRVLHYEVGSFIRIGWKGLPWTDTLAYYDHLLIAAVKVL